MFDQLFTNIEFNPKYHTYQLNGQQLKNVTGLVKQLQVPFDSAYWSERKAKERGNSQDEILAEWAAKAEQSRQLGTEVHKGIEQYLLGRPNPLEDAFLALNCPPQLRQFSQFWQQTAADTQVIKLEWVVGDATLGLAGTADCLLFKQATGQYHLFDWKTNSKFDVDNRFGKLLDPFTDLDDCKLNIYSLQLSMYQLIIERAAQIELGPSYIVHLLPNKYTLYPALDLRERAAKWLLQMVTQASF